MRLLFASFVLLSFAPALQSQELQLNSLFTDHAVLQQEIPVPVWGVGKPGAEVQVTFGAQTVKGKVEKDGNWMVLLKELTASAEPAELTVTSGKDTDTVEDILVGEVWVGSGQSNMAMNVSGTLDAEAMAEEAEGKRFDKIRLFKVPVEGADVRMNEVETTWVLPTAENVERFSATAFYFARKLSEDRSVPVGIIQSANGGTNAYSWINSDTLDSDPVAESIRTYWSAALRKHPEAMEKYKAALVKWREKAAAAKEAGTDLPGRPPREPIGATHEKRPAGHYNAMIAPLQPYAIRGVIWYQGEANSRVPFNTEYKDLMLALVEDWRADWATAAGAESTERRDFPFYLVQLPNYAGGDPEGWPLIREQMLRFWQEGKNTGTVVTIDVGEANDIHPRNKKPVGERLATFARGNVYGENLVYSGPIYKSLTISAEKALVEFDHIGGGLKSLDGEELRHFEVADADGNFAEASAKIEGNTVVVSSEEISEPRAVRYAWKRNPEQINFGNKEGFPASPFRTDNWDK